MRKKKEEPEKPQNQERWLLTYSDLITLLLALLCMLYSMSSINEKKLEQLAKYFRSTLNNTPISQGAGSGYGFGPASAPVAASSQKGSSSGAGAGAGAGDKSASQALDEVFKTLQNYIKQNHLENQIGLENSENYVQIHLKDVVMFQPNSPEMLPTSQPIMKEIEEAISKVYAHVDHITISGHTADVVVHSTQSDQISWKLSTDRAVTVLNSLIGYGLKEDKLSIQGYSCFLPVAPNDTEEGRAKNRRVEITIYKNPTADDAMKKKSSSNASSSPKATSSSPNSTGTGSGTASSSATSTSSSQ